MDNNLIEEISGDLGMQKFHGEENKEYIYRVIYSCMACWIKTSTMDSILSDDGHIGVSKVHVLRKNQQIFQEILLRIPEASDYFEAKNQNFISEIRERLLKIGELELTGFNTDIVVHKRESASIFPGLQREIGSLYGAGKISAGLSQIRYVSQDNDFSNPSLSERADSSKWLLDYVQRVSWRKIVEIDDKYMGFNPRASSGNNYSCWQNMTINDSKNKLILLRDEESKTGYNYYLLKIEDDLYINSIDPFLVSIGEIKRIMFALRQMANNAVRAYVKAYEDSVKVSLGATLPDAEENLLYTYAWPLVNYNNKIQWIMFPEVWDYIKIHLELLGMEIVEEKYYG